MQNNPNTTTFRWLDLSLILVVALIGRVLLIATGSISFHSDEAIVALMARHMTQGEFPVFFYGQAYMGSFNVISTAAGFATIGESVMTIRIVQLVKFLLVVGTSYWATWHLSRNRVVSAVTGLTLAISHTMAAIYTATNIGGYAETLIFGNLLLILGYDLAREHLYSLWRWIALGIVAGLAWWTNALIVAFAAPVALFIFWTLFRRAENRARYAGMIGVAVVAFIVGGLPFWVYNFANDNAALALYLPFLSDTPTNIEVYSAPITQKLLGLFLFAIPTFTGIRYTWAADYFLPVIGLPVLFLYIAALYRFLRTDEPHLRDGARLLVMGVPVILLAVFLLSGFGADPTGRYFLPLLLPLGIMIGSFTEYLRQNIEQKYVWTIPVAILLAYNTAGQFNAALQNNPGITTQFDLVTHIPHTYDDELIAFLQEQGITHGYANYWVTIRTAFLSQEEIQFSATLPYKQQLTYNPADNRYEPYRVATENAETIAYINTTLLPELDPVLEERFTEAGATYDTEQIGHFIVYYNFAPTAPRIDFVENPAAIEG
ncbi:MAG: hypothetical protein AAFR56_08775 [Chloroflexota bacterium]